MDLIGEKVIDEDLIDDLFTDEDPGLGQSVLTINICLKKVQASGVSLSIKMQEPSHAEAFKVLRTYMRMYMASYALVVTPCMHLSKQHM